LERLYVAGSKRRETNKELVSKKLNLANGMEQITCLQPKVLVTVSFLKNLSAFFLHSRIFQRFELNRLRKMQVFYFSQEACQGNTSEKIDFNFHLKEQL